MKERTPQDQAWNEQKRFNEVDNKAMLHGIHHGKYHEPTPRPQPKIEPEQTIYIRNGGNHGS